MLTSVEQVAGVASYLSPVTISHNGADKGLINGIEKALPGYIDGGSSQESYLVHITPGVIQLQCRDLKSLAARTGEKGKENRAKRRETDETRFRKVVQNFYDGMQSLIDQLEDMAGWQVSAGFARRMLDQEPCIGHNLEVVHFLGHEELTVADFDFEIVKTQYDQVVYGDIPEWIFWRLVPLFDDILGHSPTTERRIRRWSSKSRRNLLKGCSELDWTPVLDRCETGQWQMAMVTLTCPGGDWLSYAPNARVFQKRFAAFQERFYRAWGTRMVGVWKKEFQRRGAPHLHVLMPIPTWGLERAGDNAQGVQHDSTLMFFREWVGWNWAEIMGATGVDFLKHAQVGTNVSTIENFSSVKNIAGYFVKYAGQGTKEYQNIAPYAWNQSPDGVGRFWGVIGVKKQVVTVLVSKEEFLAWGRTLARCCRANFPGSRRFTGDNRAGWCLSEDLSDTVSIVTHLAAVMQARCGSVFEKPVGMRGSITSRMRRS